MSGVGAGKLKLGEGIVYQWGALTATNDVVYDAGDLIRIVSLTATPVGSISPALPYSSQVQWSPQGDKIAYIGSEGSYPPPDTASVYVMNADGTNSTLLARLPNYGYDQDVHVLRWSPDGTKIAIVQQHDPFNAPALLKLSVIDVGTGAATQLGDIKLVYGGHYPILIAWAKDGSRLYFSRYSDSHLCSIPASGGSSTDISQAIAGSPTLSKDGSRLAYTQGTSIIVCSPDGTNKEIAYTSPRGSSPEGESFY
jgi:Tol biopolymer transport system component